ELRLRLRSGDRFPTPIEPGSHLVRAWLLGRIGGAVGADVPDRLRGFFAVDLAREVVVRTVGAAQRASVHHQGAKTLAIVGALAVAAGAGPSAVSRRLRARLRGVRQAEIDGVAFDASRCAFGKIAAAREASRFAGVL